MRVLSPSTLDMFPAVLKLIIFEFKKWERILWGG